MYAIIETGGKQYQVQVGDEIFVEKLGVEVLYDDRNIRPGVMFADADLYGIPVRAVVSPKTCERGVIEISYRDKSAKYDVAIADAAGKLREVVSEMLAQYE